MRTETHALLNTIYMSISCMILFSVFNTTTQIEPRVLESMALQSNGSYSGNGYLSLSLVNFAFAISGWFSPSLIALFGPRLCMFVSSLGYPIFVACVYQPTTWILYAGSLQFGIMNSIFNASQSTFLARISNRKTMMRNTGIFLSMLQFGRAVGSVFVSFVFRGQTVVSEESRKLLFAVAVPLALLGSISLLALRPPRQPKLSDGEAVATSTSIQEDRVTLGSMDFPNPVDIRDDMNEQGSASKKIATETTNGLKQAAKSFVLAVRLLGARPMQLLFLLFCYTGFFSTYAGTVYGTSISHMAVFGSMANSLMSLSATVYAIANLLSALTGILLAPVIYKYGRDMVMLTVYVTHMTVYCISFLQLPSQSSLINKSGEPTELQFTYTQPSAILLLCCSFLLGFSESQQTSQIFSILQEINCSPAQSFTIYRFFYSICVTASFFLANVLNLQWQLLILVITATCGYLGFLFAEMHCVTNRNTHKNYCR